MSPEDIAKTLRKDCSPCLRDVDYKRYPLYRGIKAKHATRQDPLKLITPRKDRAPKDIPIEIHKILDKIFKELYGWKVRSEGIFCTGEISTAEEYGVPNVIFPIGKYKFLYSINDNLWDIYDYLRSEIGIIEGFPGGHNYYIDNYPKEVLKEKWEKVREDIKKYYSSDNLTSAIKSKKEIALKCQAYYAVSLNIIDKVTYFL